MWELYETLIEPLPSDLVVDWYSVGNHWTIVRAGGNCGVALTVKSEGRRQTLPASLTGMPLKELAAYSKSWNFIEASLGVAALNCWYNRLETVQALPGFVSPGEVRDDLRSRKQQDAFFAFADEIPGKKVTVIGHFPHIEKRLGSICQLSVLERNPRQDDYPDSACEFILPEQDYVFITGMTLINKTLPRLLQITGHAKVSLVGPSVPLTPALFSFGADNLSGFAVTDPDKLDEIIRRGETTGIFRAGRMVSVNTVPGNPF